MSEPPPPALRVNSCTEQPAAARVRLRTALPYPAVPCRAWPSPWHGVARCGQLLVACACERLGWAGSASLRLPRLASPRGLLVIMSPAADRSSSLAPRAPTQGHLATLPAVDTAHDSHGDDAVLEPDNDLEPPEHQPHLWPTSSLTEAIADLRKGLAQLVSPRPGDDASRATRASSHRETAAPPAAPRRAVLTSTTITTSGELDATSARTSARTSAPSSAAIQSAIGQLVTASSHADVEVDMPQSSSSTTDASTVTSDLFRVPSRFALPISSPNSATTIGSTVSEQRRRGPGRGPGVGLEGGEEGGPLLAAHYASRDDPDKHGGSTVVQRNNVMTLLTARRLIQLTGPGGLPGLGPMDGRYPATGGASSGASAGAPAPNMTGVVGQRGSVAGTLAGSLHGGVNVLLGG